MSSVAVEQAAQEEILHPSTIAAPKYDFAFNDFLAKEYRFGIGTGRPVCKAFLQGHCPAGNSCPDKHHAQSGFNSLVCKHWMRALCKKGEHCEFLHEYNLRRMAECNSYSRHGTCPNGDDCMYQHIDAEQKRPPCPHYDRGFCPLGPYCANRHVKKPKLCQYYLAGFCPNGKECLEGAHARFPLDLKKPVVKGQESPEDMEVDGVAGEADQKYDQHGTYDRNEHSFNGGQGQQKFGQQPWRGKKKRGGGYKPRRN